jgi:outer membrane protein OmpA-like peptidoglycan-associated protein
MKKILLSLLAIGLLINSFGQNDYKKRPALGVHFILNDFKTAASIRSTSISNVLQTKQWKQTKDMAAGLAVSYIQGLSSHVDFESSISASFLDYPVPGKALTSQNFLLLEAVATANIKLMTDHYWISPFITIGAGASKYKGYYAAIAPVGLGLQVNLFDDAFILINSQYRIPITENAAYHLYHSFGIAGNIGKKKDIIMPVVVPPVVVIEVPKDRDGDGVLDVNDKCPDVAGIASLQGCPDKDGDGITDTDDKCPTVAGLAKYQGCPIPDSDGDGINDEQDKCATVKGVARYQGCPIPDTDGDGVNDEDDKCPNRVGPADNFGCPVIGIRSYEIAFKSGSAVLLSGGKLILDTVVNYLNTNSGVNVTVDGHTDNSGTDKINDPLSLKRAEASKAYIVSKGIASDRMTTGGFGSKQPVADNKTAEGRKKNRRIEIKIKE